MQALLASVDELYTSDGKVKTFVGHATFKHASYMLFKRDSKGRIHIFVLRNRKGGGWGLPGGMRDPGEVWPEATAKRELNEEASRPKGTELRLKAGSKRRFIDNGYVVLAGWLRNDQVLNGIPPNTANSEIDKARWVPIANVKEGIEGKIANVHYRSGERTTMKEVLEKLEKDNKFWQY